MKHPHGWSKEFIQDTLDTFGPLYAKQGIVLTEQDTEEIILNCLRLLEVLGKNKQSREKRALKEVISA